MSPQPPTTPHLSRDLVRILPFAAQFEEATENLAIAGTITALFELGSNVTDANQLGTSPAPAGTIISATGPFLDVVVFAELVGTLEISYAIGKGFGAAAPIFHVAQTAAVPASDLTNVSALRVTGRYVKVVFTNTGAATSDVEFGAYLRSS